MGATTFPASVSFDAPAASLFGAPQRIRRPSDLLELGVDFAAHTGRRWIRFLLPSQHAAETPYPFASVAGALEWFTAAPTVLVFEVPASVWPGVTDLAALTLDEMLDWSQLILVLHPRAASTADRLNAIQLATASAEPGPDGLAATSIAVPAGLALSPDEQAIWEFPAGLAEHNGRTDIWWLRLTGPDSGDLALRAVGATDFAQDAPAWSVTGDPLSPADRANLVYLTGVYGGVDVASTTAPLSTVDSSVVELGMVGATVDLRGAYADLESAYGARFPNGTAAALPAPPPWTLQQMTRSIARGRDQHAVTAAVRTIHLWGHRVLTTTTYDRRVESPSGGPIAYWQTTHTTVKVLQKTLDANAAPVADASQFGRLFVAATLLDCDFPDVSVDGQGNVTLGSSGQGAPVHLRVRLTDTTGATFTVDTPLRLDPEPDGHQAVDRTPVTVQLHGRRLCYVQGQPGATSFETDTLDLTPAAQAGQGFVVSAAVVRHPAARQFAAADTLHLQPCSHVVLAGSNQDLQYARLAAPVMAEHPTPGRAAGLSHSKLPVNALSVTHGLLQASGGSATPDFSGCSLLGLVPLDRFAPIAPPVISTARDDDGTTTTLTYGWNASNGGPKSLSIDGGHVVLSVDSAAIVVSRVRSSSGKTSSSTDETLGNVSLTLSADGPTGPGSVTLDFDSIHFREVDGQRPTLVPAGQSLSFGGQLKFVQDVLAYLPPDLFSNPPAFTVSDTAATLEYRLGLPSIAAGLFQLTDVAVDASVAIPLPGLSVLTGDAVPDLRPTVSFGLATKDKPFTLAVGILGGGGWFTLVTSPAGVLIDAGLDFGGTFGFDVVIASGGVSLTGGIRLTHELDGDLQVGGFVHLSGGLEILDLASVSIDVMVELDYDVTSDAFTGSAEVSVRVSVLFFHQSFSWTTTHTFGGGGGGTSPSPEMATRSFSALNTAADSDTGDHGWSWDAYAAAFCPPIPA